MPGLLSLHPMYRTRSGRILGSLYTLSLLELGSTLGPTCLKTPAASYHRRAANAVLSKKCPSMNIESARYKPIACPCRRTLPLPGCWIASSTLSTSGPPRLVKPNYPWHFSLLLRFLPFRQGDPHGSHW